MPKEKIDKLQQRLNEERSKRKDEKRRQKELMKAKETPEEKRARRLAKKLAKEQKRKEDMGWDEECLGYTNVDNPFGDKSLLETFVWKKKLEKEGLAEAPRHQVEQISRRKLEENKKELEKIRRMREQRETQKEDYEMMMRDRENQQHAEWSKQEDKFHLQQARLRSKIRIQEGRAKPIDLLSRCVDFETGDNDEDLSIEMNEPYTYLKGLTIRDLEDLIEDIRVYRVLEGNKNSEYWDDVKVIAEDELQKLKKYDPNSSEYVGDRRHGIHTSVMKDVVAILKGKTHHELALLETEIRKKMKQGGQGVDVGYWETLLAQLKSHMARARLRDHHEKMLRRRLIKMQEEQGLKSEIAESSDRDSPGPSTSFSTTATTLHNKPDNTTAATLNCQVSESTADDKEESAEDREADAVPWESLTYKDKREKMREAYLTQERPYSPNYLVEDSIPAGTEIVDPLEDQHRIQFARAQLKNSGSVSSQRDATLESIARQGMSEEERKFSNEEPLAKQTYLWSDKYRPRKPRYFNRVHTGFEWNKYNQTHYDLDNPPPKIVQGYKFNIFYPDLLDTSKAPEFTLTPAEDSEDFAVLKFKAGPPYEDIAFKIVNREWEVSHKRGYRCQFQNGIFQLWFHFKKYRYRR